MCNRAATAFATPRFAMVHDPRAVDPVCHAPLDEAHAVIKLYTSDAEFWFCSLSCALRFASGWMLAASQDPRN